MAVLKFAAVPTPASIAERVAIHDKVDGFVATAQTFSTTGSELHSLVVSILGYGARDERLQVVLSRIQKHLERRS